MAFWLGRAGVWGAEAKANPVAVDAGAGGEAARAERETPGGDNRDASSRIPVADDGLEDRSGLLFSTGLGVPVFDLAGVRPLAPEDRSCNERVRPAWVEEDLR